MSRTPCSIARGPVLAAALLALALLAGACGGESGASAESEPPAAAEEPSAAATAAADDDPLAALASAAAEEGPVIWYESTPTEDMQPAIDAFTEQYPDVEVEHVRIEGGRQVAARIIQESQAGGETADIGTSGPDNIVEMQERGLLAELTTDELMVDEEVLPAPYALVTAASVYIALHNTDAVSAEDAPASWEDLADERWRGQLGTWAVPAAQANLAAEWGEERAREYTEQLAAQEPKLYASTFPLAADVGSGEVPVALGIYHTAQPPIEAGAPIEVTFLEPTAMSTIYTGLVAESPNPNAARLFLSWLHSDEGAQAYEAATGRGNPYLATETAELLADRTISEWPLEETQKLQELQDEFRPILEAGGTPVEE